jgi:putative membrane protein
VQALDDPQLETSVADLVSLIEQRTDAEIVVVVARRSAEYRDIPWMMATVGSAVLMAFVLFSPLEFHPWLIPLDAGLGFAAFWWIGTRDAIKSWLVTSSRREKAVRDAAAAEFVREAVHGTPNRSGVLIYCSRLEREVVVIADMGVERAVPQAALAVASRRIPLDSLRGFCAGVEDLGKLLAEHLPHGPQSDGFDLPNRPRIRP